MKFIAENLIYIQSDIVSIGLIFLGLYLIINYRTKNFNIIRLIVDYGLHRKDYKKYMEERKKKND